MLTGPEHRHLFEAAEPPGFYGHQIGEEEPNQPKDYGRGQVYNPYGNWENPYHHYTGATGAFNHDYQNERQAQLAQERLDSLVNQAPYPATFIPEEDPAPHVAIWQSLNQGQKATVEEILKLKKALRDFRSANVGPSDTPTLVEKGVRWWLANGGLPTNITFNGNQVIDLSMKRGFNTVQWNLAMKNEHQYDYLFTTQVLGGDLEEQQRTIILGPDGGGFYPTYR